MKSRVSLLLPLFCLHTEWIHTTTRTPLQSSFRWEIIHLLVPVVWCRGCIIRTTWLRPTCTAVIRFPARKTSGPLAFLSQWMSVGTPTSRRPMLTVYSRSAVCTNTGPRVSCNPNYRPSGTRNCPSVSNSYTWSRSSKKSIRIRRKKKRARSNQKNRPYRLTTRANHSQSCQGLLLEG